LNKNVDSDALLAIAVRQFTYEPDDEKSEKKNEGGKVLDQGFPRPFCI